MNKPAQKLREILKRRGVTTAQLASAVGISARTFYNICCGNSASRRARQALTDLLQVQLWDDIRIRARPLMFWSGLEIKSPTIASAKRTAHELRGFVTRRGTIVYVTKPVLVTVPRRALQEQAELEKKKVEVLNALSQTP